MLPAICRAFKWDHQTINKRLVNLLCTHIYNYSVSKMVIDGPILTILSRTTESLQSTTTLYTAH